MVRNVGGKFTTSEDGMQVVKVDNFSEILTGDLAVENVSGGTLAVDGPAAGLKVINAAGGSLDVEVTDSVTVANMTGVWQRTGWVTGMLGAASCGKNAAVGVTVVDLHTEGDIDYPSASNTRDWMSDPFLGVPAVRMAVSSSAAADALVEVRITGLTEAGVWVTHDVILDETDGRTPIIVDKESTPAEIWLVRVLGFENMGEKAAEGKVYLYRHADVGDVVDGVPDPADEVFAVFESPHYRDLRAAFTTPVGAKGAVLAWNVSTDKAADMFLMRREKNGMFVTYDAVRLPAGGVAERVLHAPLPLDEGADVVIRAKGDAAETAVTGSISVYVVNN